MCWINFNSEQPVLAHLCKPLKFLCQHKGGNEQLRAEEASFGTSANFYQFEAVMKLWVRLANRLKLIWGCPPRSALWSLSPSYPCRTVQEEAVWFLFIFNYIYIFFSSWKASREANRGQAPRLLCVLKPLLPSAQSGIFLWAGSSPYSSAESL